jgi:hypothetical protein
MQYPTIGQPQYGFAPTMPGMARGGLAALANQYRRGGGIRYYEEGGDTTGGGADASTEGGAGAAFGGGNDPGPGPGGSDPGVGGGTDPGVGGGTDPGAAAQAAAQAVDNAVDFGVDVDAAQATLGAQVAAEEDEAEAENAANTAAALGAQANAIAAEAKANAEEDAKNAEMAAVMSGQVAGFPGPAPAPSFGFSVQNPLNTNIKEAFGLFNPLATVTTPLGKADFSVMDFAAPAMGRGASAVNNAVNAGRAMGFAEGGLAAAQQTQSKGRGQDTMLVHMTPGEVKGLQALAMSQGGSLTINPQTGLPEAGFLSSILPMIAGFALGPAGFALMSAPMAGLTVGALTGVATGSLKKGLMAGLGAYGGAGIGQGLVNAATPIEAAIPTGTEAGLTSAADMATSNLSPELLNSPISTSTSGIDPGLLESRGLTPNSPYFKMAQSNIDPGLLEGMGGTPGMTAQQVATAPVINPTPSIPTSPTTGFTRAGEGFTNMFDTGQVGTNARSAFMKATPTGSLTAAGTTVASALTPEPAPLPTSKSFIRGYDLNIANPSGTPQYTPQDTREREQVRYTYSPREIYEVAEGGQIDSDYDMAVSQNGAFSDNYKEGGLSALAKRRKALAGISITSLLKIVETLVCKPLSSKTLQKVV